MTVLEVLAWMEERGRNSRSFGSHADAYEIAARKLREALERSANHDGKSLSETGPNFSDVADDGPTGA